MDTSWLSQPTLPGPLDNQQRQIIVDNTTGRLDGVRNSLRTGIK
jgi:hypothetical protein